MSSEVPSTAKRGFKEDRFDYKQQNQAVSNERTYSLVHVSCCKYSTWIFTALLIAGIVIILFGIVSLISAHGIAAIGEGGAIGIIVGGGLMSSAGAIGILRNFFQSQREEIQRI